MYYFYRLNFVSPTFTIFEAGTSLDWDGDTKVYFINVIKTLFCWVYIGVRGNEKADLAAKSAFDLPRVKVGVP